jgi:hypothetical protein
VSQAQRSQLGGKPPISALTYAFSIGLDRGRETDDFGSRIVAPNGGAAPLVNRSDNLGDDSKAAAKAPMKRPHAQRQW